MNRLNKNSIRLSVQPLEDRSLAAAGLLSSAIDFANPPLPSVTASLGQGVLRVKGTFLPVGKRRPGRANLSGLWTKRPPVCFQRESRQGV